MAAEEILKDIRKVAPNATVDLETIVNTLVANADAYGLTTEARLEAFLAQATQETDKFRSLKEYASGAAYEGRADLGNTQAGDGIKFKGRGIFMTTGRANYKATSHDLFGDDRLLDHPELLEDPANATKAALYFWKSRNLNQYADSGDFETLTKRINGGLNGWKERLSNYEKFKLYITNGDANDFINDAKQVFVRHPELSIATASAFFLLTGFYIYKKAKGK